MNSPPLLVSPHFALTEFRCHDGTDYPAEWIDERLRPLCAVLEAIRAACDGHSVTILSGYRSPAHNVAVGGAKASQHMEGRAADITVAGLAPSDVWTAIDALLKAGQLTGLGGRGIYPGWVHVDVRPRPIGGHIAIWSGEKVGDEQA